MTSGGLQFMSYRINQAIDNFTLLILTAFMGYVFWFQYSFSEIDGLLIILGVLMGGLFLLRIRLNIKHYKSVGYVLLFLVSCTISGVLVSIDGDVCFQLLIRIIRYVIPMFCLYNYIGRDYSRAKRIMTVLSLVIFALSVSLIMKGSINIMGATVIGDLNANVFSSFLLLGIAANFFLMNCTQSKFVRIVLMCFLVVELIAQAMAASRRGILVFVFMILTYMHSLLSIKFQHKTMYKLVVILLVAVIGTIAIVNLMSMSDRFIIFQEFGRTSGDSLRTQYQNVAWEQFLRSPILGLGLGAVQSQIGMYSHSMYYELLACCGISGMIIILIPQIRKIISFWKFSNSSIGENIELRMQARLMAWLIISMLITGIAVVYFYDANFYILLAIIGSIDNIFRNNFMKGRRDSAYE